MKRLAGKTVVIFGAAGGIGSASARLFAQEGASLLLADKESGAGLDLCSELKERGAHADFREVDVTSSPEVERTIGEAEEKFGGLNVVFNCVGGSSSADGLIEHVSDDEFWRTIRVDLYGAWLTCKFGIPALVRSGGGSMINMTSAAAVRGPIGVNAYTAAKGGVSALTRALAVGYAAKGVRVNAIAPAATRTPRIERLLVEKEDVRINLRRKQPLGLIEPEEIGSMALYLASDESRSTTGQILSVDGGYSA